MSWGVKQGFFEFPNIPRPHKSDEITDLSLLNLGSIVGQNNMAIRNGKPGIFGIRVVWRRLRLFPVADCFTYPATINLKIKAKL